MKKKITTVIKGLSVLLVIVCIFLFVRKIHINKVEREEYSRCVGDNIDTDLSSTDPYTTGYNRDGIRMYVNPKGAFNQIKTDYQEEIRYIQEHAKLSELSYAKIIIEQYKNNSWQIDTKLEGEEKSNQIAKNLIKLSQALAMLLNSFK